MFRRILRMLGVGRSRTRDVASSDTTTTISTQSNEDKKIDETRFRRHAAERMWWHLQEREIEERVQHLKEKVDALTSRG